MSTTIITIIGIIVGLTFFVSTVYADEYMVIEAGGQGGIIELDIETNTMYASSEFMYKGELMVITSYIIPQESGEYMYSSTTIGAGLNLFTYAMIDGDMAEKIVSDKYEMFEELIKNPQPEIITVKKL